MEEIKSLFDSLALNPTDYLLNAVFRWMSIALAVTTFGFVTTVRTKSPNCLLSGQFKPKPVSHRYGVIKYSRPCSVPNKGLLPIAKHAIATHPYLDQRRFALVQKARSEKISREAFEKREHQVKKTEITTLHSKEDNDATQKRPYLLLNNSGTDCCFNSVVQSLRMLRSLDSLTTDNAIWSNILHLRRSEGFKNIGTLRKDLGFDDEQQCAAEILQKCLEELNENDQAVFTYKQTTEGSCSNCNNKRTVVENEVVMRLADRTTDNATSISDLLKNHTTTIQNIECTKCGISSFEETASVDFSKNNVLLIQLPLFCSQGRRRAIQLTDQFNSVVSFMGESWRVKAGIYHFGQTMFSGHYMAITNQGSNGWTMFNDDRKPMNLSKVLLDYKEVYLIFLEKEGIC